MAGTCVCEGHSLSSSDCLARGQELRLRGPRGVAKGSPSSYHPDAEAGLWRLSAQLQSSGSPFTGSVTLAKLLELVHSSSVAENEDPSCVSRVVGRAARAVYARHSGHSHMVSALHV